MLNGSINACQLGKGDHKWTKVAKSDKKCAQSGRKSHQSGRKWHQGARTRSGV